MAAKSTVRSYKRVQGISTYSKESVIPDQVYFCRSIDYRTNPQEITLLKAPRKISGNQVTDLPKWITEAFGGYFTFFYGDTGNIYRCLLGINSSFSPNLHTVTNSNGQGMAFYKEDNYLYYTSQQTIGRYGPIDVNYYASVSGGTEYGTFSDDFLGAEGGIPLNTYSIDLESGSSQYADRADTASLSITGDITLEAYFKPESLPTAGNSMVLISKWNESGVTRSYRMDLYGLSGYFGDGSDGALTVSANTTKTNIDSACTGSQGSTSLSATNVSFAAGQRIIIHQSQGSNAGYYMLNKILSYTAGTITLESPLTFSPGSGAQVVVTEQYSGITVNSGVTWSAKAWNGTVGGILAVLCSGTVTINGTVSAGTLGPGEGFSTNNQGYRGNTTASAQGEGTAAAGGTISTSANGSGGGGGSGTYAGGGGGANATNATTGSGTTGGSGGNLSGNNDLTIMTFGGAGGSGSGTVSASGGAGGYGGGIVLIIGTTITLNSSTGYIKCNGSDGQVGGDFVGGGGGGGGGSVLLRCQTGTLETNRILAQGGNGGGAGTKVWSGGAGTSGRIHIDYYTSYTGTTTPTITAAQDNSLVTTTTYQARLGISSTGSNSEYLTKNITVTTDIWYRLSITWDASASEASFYMDGTLVGTSVGTLTAIHDNASRFGIGMSFNGAGAAANFFDGKMDDVRVWNVVQDAAYINAYNQNQLTGTESGIQAYYKLNNNANDTTANANNLTASGGPVYDLDDVPFPSPTTRQDIDQSSDTSGNTYTIPAAISEAATDRKTITPGHDPLKSISLKFATAGTTITITVHDVQNRPVAYGYVAATGTGYNEIFLTYQVGQTQFPWSPIIGNSYHFHVTGSGGTLTTSAANDLETVGFVTYFNFLLYDDNYHSILPILNMLAICNGNYLATLEGIIYEPNRLNFGTSWKTRCLAYWREYLAIGCIYEIPILSSEPFISEKGRIYFWDGISDTWNFFIDVPEGAVNAMIGVKGELHILAGNRADHLKYVGGDSAQKIRRFPKITLEDTMQIGAGAITASQGLIQYGAAIYTSSSIIEQGVYSYGTLDQMYPETLSYDYVISTGSRTSTDVSIGSVLGYLDGLLIGWKDGVSYGVDLVNSSSSYASSGTVEFLINDEDYIWKDQLNTQLRLDFESLQTGESVDVKIQFDRSGTWTKLSAPVTSASDIVESPGYVKLSISNGRSREYQLAYDLYSTGSTSPTILGISTEIHKLGEEEQL